MLCISAGGNLINMSLTKFPNKLINNKPVQHNIAVTLKYPEENAQI